MSHLWFVYLDYPEDHTPLLVKTSGREPDVAARVAETVLREQGNKGALVLFVYPLCQPEGDTGVVYVPEGMPNRYESRVPGSVIRRIRRGKEQNGGHRKSAAQR